MPFFQQRIKRTYPAIQLPVVTEDEDRGLPSRCCVLLPVLASLTSEDSWKNDIEPVWMKLSDPTDTLLIELLDSSGAVVTAYPITNIEFPNEPNAFHAEVHWKDVLDVAGADCYKIRVTYEVGGLPETSFIWGSYKLKPYSIQNALTTARIRCKFNMKQAIEGINFTGANVQGTLRFNGQIRKDQPNTVRENLVYSDRMSKPVVWEKLQTWAMKTDPYTDDVLKKFEDLYLLSGTEIFISDYNAHTNSYQIFDVPVTIEETEQREQVDELARPDVLTCVFSNRKKNERTYY